MLSFLRARPRLLIISIAFVTTVGFAFLSQAPNQKNNPNPNDSVTHETGDLAEDIIAIFTVVLAGVGALTYFTFDRQADVMAGTLAQMKIDAANRARETADQIQLARDEFNAAYRPEIAMQSVVAHCHVANDRLRIGASVMIFNRGRIAAAGVKVRGRITRTNVPHVQSYWDEIETRSDKIARGIGHQFLMKSDYPVDEEIFNHTFSEPLPASIAWGRSTTTIPAVIPWAKRASAEYGMARIGSQQTYRNLNMNFESAPIYRAPGDGLSSPE